jgi:hypothetical protein
MWSLFQHVMIRVATFFVASLMMSHYCATNPATKRLYRPTPLLTGKFEFYVTCRTLTATAFS